MKLVEKKCPNCGAGLSFNTGDKEVTCKYCNAVFDIEHDISDLIDKEKIANMANNLLDPEAFSLHQKTVRRMGSIIMVFSLIVFVVIFIFFIIHFLSFPRIGG
jgi:uncharacterized protein YbaR (Trm112 family)